MANERRGILKGHLFGAVQTRNMFVAQVSVNEGDTWQLAMKEYMLEVIDPMVNLLTNQWTTDTIEMQYLSGGVWYTDSEIPLPGGGGAGGDTLANLVAAVMVGVVYGVHAHGRKFWSGLGESVVNGNALTGAAMITFASAVAAYVAPYTSTGGSQVQPGIMTKAGIFQPFTSGFASSLLGSMRRRKPGLGI